MACRDVYILGYRMDLALKSSRLIKQLLEVQAGSLLSRLPLQDSCDMLKALFTPGQYKGGVGGDKACLPRR